MHSRRTMNPLRFLLFPFAILYGIIIHVRNFLFDKKILKPNRFSTPTICVGNLSVGGTGKTPMTEMLLSLLQHQYKIATLSRGYKRKTKGFLIADKNTTANDIGDEPMQFHKKFPEVLVSVGEDRTLAIQQLEKIEDAPQVIILDDAMQHRKVQAHFNILLTDYNNLYVDDYFLPVGSLRDQRSSSKRADIIVVTKCPSNIDLNEKIKIETHLKPHSQQKVFFATIDYGTPYDILTGEKYVLSENDKIVAIAGIAKPQPYFYYLQKLSPNVDHITLSDHHNFTEAEIINLFSKHKNTEKNKQTIYILTEKDAVKIQSYQHVFINLSARIYVLPIKCVILGNESGPFLKKVIAIIDNIQN